MSRLSLLPFLVFAAACATAGDGMHPGYFDGLVFSLGIKGAVTPGDSSTYANIYDEMSVGAATPLVATAVSTFNPSANATTYEKFGTPDPICVTNEYMAPSAYPWTSNRADAIYFPVSKCAYTTDAGVVTNACFPQTVKFNRSVSTGSNVTYHVRFKWDGNIGVSYEQYIFENGRDANGGFGFRIYATSDAYRFGEAASANLRYYVAGGNFNHYLTIMKGAWYDLVVRMTWTNDCDGAGNPGTKISMVCPDNSQYGDAKHVKIVGTASGYVKNRTCATAASAATSLPFFLGQGDATISKWYNVDTARGRSFRGAVAKVQIYDRALSDDEMMALYTLSDGTKVSIGSENGSSNEFGTDGAAATYEPLTMPMRLMRGELTAANPSLAVKFPMRGEEVGLSRILWLAAIADGTGASAPVSLSVNGVYVGTKNFGTSGAREFPIHGRFMTTNENGDVTLTLVRAGDTAGAVKIDALKLCGSWQLGAADNSRDDWCFRASDYVSHLGPAYSTKAWGVVGWPYEVDTLFKTLYGEKNTLSGGSPVHYYSAQTLAFYLSPNMAMQYPSRFEFRNYGGPAANTRAAIYTNGAICSADIPITAAQTKVGVDFAAGAFKPGLNLITVSNASANVGMSSQYASISLDYYKFEVTLPKTGTTILVK